MLFVIFFLGAFIGVGAGWAAAMVGQAALEQRYKQSGIAKIDGEFYRITKIDNARTEKDNE